MKRILLTALALVMCLSTVALLSSCACEHTCSTEPEWDDDNHWSVCDDCGEKYDEAAHEWGDTSRVSVGTHKHACTVCKHEAYITYETEATEEQFEAAKLGTNYSVIGGAVAVSNPDAKQHISIKRADNKLYTESVTSTPASGEKRDIEFYEIVDNKVYEYDVVCDDDGNVTKCTKEESEAPVDALINSYEHIILPEGLLDDMSKFTYSEESKMYEADSISLASGLTLTKVKAGFEDGKLVMIKYIRSEFYDYSFELSYNDAEITIPEVTE